ncbi:MAG TPA: hypothetical protein PLK67_08525 [Bryobacteraceae bacterium]|nr:hypothetical protein [Bryobacteraceae bacterium]
MALSVTTMGVTSVTSIVVVVSPGVSTGSITTLCCTWTVKVASYFLIPGDSTTMRYVPGETPGK